MAFLFKSKAKAPVELSRHLKDVLHKFHALYGSSTITGSHHHSPEEKKNLDKLNEEITKTLHSMKNILYDDNETPPSQELVFQLAHEIFNNDLLSFLVIDLIKLEFEARKYVFQIFSGLLRNHDGTQAQIVDYLVSHQNIFVFLIKGYENQDIALICGMILRDCIKQEKLSDILLNSVDSSLFDVTCSFKATAAKPLQQLQPQSASATSAPQSIFEPSEGSFNANTTTETNHQAPKSSSPEQPGPSFCLIYKFFEYVELPTFDIASDAFATLKKLLTKQKTLVSEFLLREYDYFFSVYNRLLNSSNYVTRRQSLKLIGELLLDRNNFDSMTQYINSTSNLKLIMNLLKDKSKNIQFEAFQVFKIFVANPNKCRGILDIIVKNKEKLLGFLNEFQSERTDDEQFNQEKAFIIQQIQALESPTAFPSTNMILTPPDSISTFCFALDRNSETPYLPDVK